MVQTRMRHLITERIAESHRQVADLVSFTAQLQETASQHGVHSSHPGGGMRRRLRLPSEPAPSKSNR